MPGPGGAPGSGGSPGGSMWVICAASSVAVMPDSAARRTSWRWASAGVQPSCSISMPLARSTTERAAAAERSSSNSPRCRSTRAFSRARSAPFASVTAPQPSFQSIFGRGKCPGQTCFVSVPFSAITRRDRIFFSGLAWYIAPPRDMWPAMEGFGTMTTIHHRAVQSADGGLQQLLAGLSAVRSGDFSTRLPTDGDPLMDEIASVFNGMNEQLALFTSEVTRVAREVGTEGRLGGQAEVPGLAGTWKDLTDSVNSMAGNLTGQVRDVARVATAVAKGDLSQQISVDVKGEMLELKDTLNTMVDELSAFADEVTRVAREVGTEGRLGGQARVPGVGGTWRDLTDSVNVMASNLTAQVRSISQVATAVARGDLSQTITVEAKGEVATLAESINSMVDTLGAFAGEVTRVAREVGTEGMLGGQATVPNVAGTWKDLTDNVNSMANNLTSQVRNIAQVTTAVAQGDLSKKIDV